jgi:bifunctional pyridoxal-dependent enzyme with beta-cystathionase and maltose regulon repressor activities
MVSISMLVSAGVYLVMYLRGDFANWQKKQHDWDLDPDNVVIANGLLSSLVLMLEAVSAPGDGVIIFTPVFPYFF